MPAIDLKIDDSVLVLVDLQPKFLAGIWECDRVLDRSEFLTEVARLLGVPILATVQNADRMGPIDERFQGEGLEPIPKMCFSCLGSAEFLRALEATGRRQVVLAGVETHICVGQTAQGLLAMGYEVAVAPDAVSAGSMDRHKLGMERIRDAGGVPIHSEAVAYDWMKSADHPRFREVLARVKAHR